MKCRECVHGAPYHDDRLWCEQNQCGVDINSDIECAKYKSLEV